MRRRRPSRRPATRLAVGLALALNACGALAADNPLQTAEEPAWRPSAALEVWSYAHSNSLVTDSSLNPGNRVARLPGHQFTLDARLNGRLEQGGFDLVWAARLLEERRWVRSDTSPLMADTNSSLRLGQALLRYKQASSTLALGREVFTWGPANFRSPSNPFYFDAGKTNPLASTPGLDLARFTYGQGKLRATAAHVVSTSQLAPGVGLAHSNVLKLEHLGSEHLMGLVVSRSRDRRAFVGAYASFQPDDAWSLYGELGASRQAAQLIPGAAGQFPPFVVAQPASRAIDTLLGATYTFESGQTLSLEWLHSTGGYSRAQRQDYFRQADSASLPLAGLPESAIGALGMALSLAPRLLGRDYLWLGWGSNTQDSSRLWRVAWTQNLSDGSAQLMLYGEKNLWPRVSAFASLSAYLGGARSEYGALLRHGLIVGAKFFVF